MTRTLHALTLAALVTWLPVRVGVWRGDTRMAASGPLSTVHAVVLKLDPRVLQFALDTVTRDDRMRGAWTVEQTPLDAVVALNAGQFTGGIPWGWLVKNGDEIQPPGRGPLSMAFVIDSAGRAHLVDPDEMATVRGHVAQAFQSYPALLIGTGALPSQLTDGSHDIDLTHRDSRLALGLLADGSLVIALTRFTAMGKAGERLPFGPTVGEMAAFMRALGCERAMLLDGGISSQLAIRAVDGSLTQWSNFRAVPLALVITPRRNSANQPSPLRATRER